MGYFATLAHAAFKFPEDANAFTMDNQAEARFSTGPFAHTVLMGRLDNGRDGICQIMKPVDELKPRAISRAMMEDTLSLARPVVQL